MTTCRGLFFLPTKEFESKYNTKPAQMPDLHAYHFCLTKVPTYLAIDRYDTLLHHPL